MHALHARVSVALLPAVLRVGYVAGHESVPAFAAHTAIPVGFGAQTFVPVHPAPTRAGGAQSSPFVIGGAARVVAESHAAGGAGGVLLTNALPFGMASGVLSNVHPAFALTARVSVTPPVQMA